MKLYIFAPFFFPPLCLVLFLQIDSAFSCGLFRKPRLRKSVASFVASECRVLKTKTEKKKTELVFRCRVYFDMCVCVCVCAHFSPPSQVDFFFFSFE
uniref:Putative secreted protein n=1 Tax=Ixodes ricinus TaxID=34613 RepID=A0A6B0UHX6_IXORI